jgi:hypothetical protein
MPSLPMSAWVVDQDIKAAQIWLRGSGQVSDSELRRAQVGTTTAIEISRLRTL